MASNHIQNVALVGASGQIGTFVAKELLSAGTFTVTAITREEGGSSNLPEGVKVARINYDQPSTIEAALKGQDALIISLNAMAKQGPEGPQAKLITAASKAGVPFVIPNQWGGDSEDEDMPTSTVLAAQYKAAHELVQELGNLSWIDINCGFWYEYSLGRSIDCYGFDMIDKRAVFFDDGTTKITTSTWPQTGRAVAKLLGLKIAPDGPDDESPTLQQFRNKSVRVGSFSLSQRDMFESVKRVTGTTDADWTITHEPSQERFDKAREALGKGDRTAFARLLYSRSFFPSGEADLANTKGLHNELLGLPHEDLDEATEVAFDMAENGSAA